MTKLTMDDLERQYDGSVPQRLKDIVIHGSTLLADIAELETLVEAITWHFLRATKAVKVCRKMADADASRRAYYLEQAEVNATSAREYATIMAGIYSRLLDMKEGVTP